MTRQKKSLSRKLWEAALILVFLPIAVPFALIALALYFPNRLALYVLVWVLWLSKGKDTLVVYSDSPIWHEYMVTQILPLVRERAVVMNWSERGNWSRWSFRVHIFHYFAGDREFNPLVVLFRPFRRAKTFRFWLPFKDWKRGYGEPLDRLREELFSAL
jgi:hypothetical protein